MQQITLHEEQIKRLISLLDRRSATAEDKEIRDSLKSQLKHEQLTLLNLDEIPF